MSTAGDGVEGPSKVAKQAVMARGRSKARRVRGHVLERAGEECEVCGWCSYMPGILHVHHIVPLEQVSAGWSKDFDFNSPDNLVCICPNCHSVVHKAMSRSDDMDFYSLSTFYPLQPFRKLCYLMMGITRDKWEEFDKLMSLADFYDISEDGDDPVNHQ